MQAHLLVLTTLLFSTCLSFDIGHHHDITVATLKEYGFSQDATDVALIHNWFTDFYSTFPSVDPSVKLLTRLHFDNLLNSNEIAQYWTRFANNSKMTIQNATAEGNTLKYLAYIGHNTHAVQDFYAHSNWNTFFPRTSCGCLRNDTFWHYLDQLPQGLLTGVYPCKECADRGNEDAPHHGDYCEGVNKDSYARPQWDEAYTFGYYATMEWINTLQMWASEIDPLFVSQARNFTASDDLKDDISKELQFMYEISLWVRSPSDADGHWKGPGSGSLDDFTAAIAKTATLSTPFRAMLKDNGIQVPLTDGLYTFANETTFVPTDIVTQNSTFDKIIVEIRIFHAETENKGSEADMYTVVIVDGQEYVDATQQNENDINPEWTTIVFIDRGTTEVNISITLYDEDIGDDQQLDINPLPNNRGLIFTYNIVTGNISASTSFDGIHNTNATGATSVGDEDNAASISFFVTTVNVGSCGSGIESAPVEPLTCRILNPEICDGDDTTNLQDSGSFVLQASWMFVFALCTYLLL